MTSYQSPSFSMHRNVSMHCICHIYTKHMIWCVCLCITRPTNKLNPWFLFEKGKESILSIARQISGLQRQYGMNLVGDYEDEFKFGLMEVVFEWARGLVSNYCCWVHSHSYRKACRIFCQVVHFTGYFDSHSTIGFIHHTVQSNILAILTKHMPPTASWITCTLCTLITLYYM